MNLAWAVFRKEMLDSVRDRRSLLSALLFPLIGPLLVALLFTYLAERSIKPYGLGLPLGVNTVGAALAPSLFGVMALPLVGAKLALLILAAVPAFFYRDDSKVMPGRERWFALVFAMVFMVFCASNQYSRLQWNTGFRYLIPLVPFAFLALSDHLARAKPIVLALVLGMAPACLVLRRPASGGVARTVS